MCRNSCWVHLRLHLITREKQCEKCNSVLKTQHYKRRNEMPSLLWVWWQAPFINNVYIWVLVLIYTVSSSEVSSLRLHTSWNHFERSLQNHQIFIQPATVYFTWFCAFNLGLMTKKNKDFARSCLAMKPLKWVSSSCALFSRDLQCNSTVKLANFRFVFRMLFYYFTHTDVRARRFWAFNFCVTTAVTVVTRYVAMLFVMDVTLGDLLRFTRLPAPWLASCQLPSIKLIKNMS